MGSVKNGAPINIDTVGGVKTINLFQPKSTFLLVLSASPLNLAGGWTIAPVLAEAAIPNGAYVEIQNPGNIILGAFALSIFGKSFTAQEAFTPGTLKCLYNDGVWTNTYIYDDAVIARMAKSHFIVEVSFESGEQCNNTIIAPCKGRFTKFRTSVIKELSGTDAGTITPAIGAVNVTSGQVIIATSAPLDEQDEATPIAALSFDEGDTLNFPAAKGTSGGKVRFIAYFDRA